MDLQNRLHLTHNSGEMDNVELLNSIQCEILEAVASYTFCCTSHLCAITQKSRSYIAENVGSLTRRKFLRAYKVIVTDKIRAEAFYTLSEKGIAALQSHKNAFPDIKAPLKSIAMARDYFHRFWYQWCMITLITYAKKNDIPVELQLSYFNKTGSKKGKLVAQTSVPLTNKGDCIIPDGIVKTSDSLYIIELYNDYGSVKRVLNSITTIAEAISIGAPGIAFNIEVSPKVLSIFTHGSTMSTVLKRFKALSGLHPEMAKLFFFSTIQDFKKDISNAKNIYDDKFILK